jgi:hypothetical protein
VLALVCLAGLSTAATGPSCLGRAAKDQPRTPRDVELPTYLTDTVGEIARFAGREDIPVEGYGFVVGLDGTGTRVVPPGVRQQILAMMQRHDVDDPEGLLASPNTAVVLVGGQLPPGVAEGEAFDLNVRALPNTETTSLEGGFLLECDLARTVASRSGDLRSDRRATGRGSIFVSPFAAAGEGGAITDPRVGRVLGGGSAVKTRQFRLALIDPSVRIADQVVRLVNSRFPGAAKGTQDPGRVDLEVPAAYRDAKPEFLDLVGAIYLREAPDTRDQRIDLLVETLEAGKDMDRVAISLEAFGPSIVPRIRTLADHPRESIRFYVGRTLAHLQDGEAVHVLGPIALDGRSEFQEEAVQALGRLEKGLGLAVLARALDAKNPRVRIAAWRAMRRVGPETTVIRVFEDKFALSIVPTKAEPFLCVARNLWPHLAIFGDVKVLPPLLAETSRATATAPAGTDRVVLFARRQDRDLRVEATLDVGDIIEKMAAPLGLDKNPTPQGLDLGYGDVVGLMNELARKRALSGTIVLEPLEYQMAGDRLIARPITVEEP